MQTQPGPADMPAAPRRVHATDLDSFSDAVRTSRDERVQDLEDRARLVREVLLSGLPKALVADMAGADEADAVTALPATHGHRVPPATPGT